MELKIKDKTREQFRDCYVIDVEFMFGDAEGEEHILFTFSTEEYNNPKFKEEVHDFIKSIISCIKLDRYGGGGFDSSIEIASWYALSKTRFGDHSRGKTYQWARFCKDAYYIILEYNNLDEDLAIALSEFKNSKFIYEIPTYDGWYGNYQRIKVFYYDLNGYKYNVDINE